MADLVKPRSCSGKTSSADLWLFLPRPAKGTILRYWHMRIENRLLACIFRGGRLSLVLSILLTWAACDSASGLSPKPASSGLPVRVAPLVLVSAEETCLYLMRHAEKQTVGEDPELTSQGEARAADLVRYFKNVDLAAVYVTATRRSRATGAVLAKAQDLALTEYSSPKDYRSFLDSLSQRHRGACVLIVGHSNTITAMLNTLTASTAYPDLLEGQHEELFRVQIVPSGVAIVQVDSLYRAAKQ